MMLNCPNCGDTHHVNDFCVSFPPAPAEAPQGVRFDVEAYVENYEFRSDEGDHTPDENERGMLIDAIHGVLSELEPASPPAPATADKLKVAMEALESVKRHSVLGSVNFHTAVEALTSLSQ